MKEIFKTIIFNQNYQVGNLGSVRSVDHFTKQNNKGKIIDTHYTGSILRPLQNKKTGYCSVRIGDKTYLIHRLVAEAFIPNPDNLPCVNHKNGIKTDNRVENLEWCSYSYNNEYNYKIGLSIPNYTEAQKKQVEDWINAGRQYCKSIQRRIICNETNELFENTRDCASKMNIDRSSLMRHLKGKLIRGKYSVKQVGGYTFRYEDDKEDDE